MKLPRSFELWRQDDNGQRFLVGRYASRAVAADRLAELTCVPHKQTYWIDEQPLPAEDKDPL